MAAETRCACGAATEAECRCAEMDDDELGDERECFWCGGDGYGECDDPIQCTRRHLGGSYDDGCPCASCGGSGLAKDMTIW